ncbi:MAG: radical SAM protein [Candidatus Diapherotrites archaeon]|nr:radical SAM protein [Candidatus Diapherotrites archaeon]
MKIAFIEPAIANVEPLGIAYLAQMLINSGHKVKYFESPRKGFMNNLKNFGPDVLAYSITTGKHRICRALNESVRKEIKAISLFGGPHCTFYPKYIKSSKFIDGICIGEGEFAIVELLKKVELKKSYVRTKNWWLRFKGKIYKNHVRIKIEDLDSLPFPNRDIIYAENKDLLESPIKRIMASRGCPYNCSYCFNRIYNALYAGKGKINCHRSPANIIAELKMVKEKYPFTFLKIVDDTFGFSMDYNEFAELYNHEIGIPFLCNIRPNLLDEKKIILLKKAGCVAVTMAVESGNEFIRNKVLNRGLSLETMSNAIKLLKKHGLRVWTQNIIGNPGESFEMAMETYNFNVNHSVDFAECFLLTPFFGTEIYNYCIKNDLLEKGIDVDNMSQSYWLGSCIQFNSQKDKNKFINFHKFFGFATKHPKLFPIIMLLIKLPPNNFFVLFNRFYDAWRISRVIRAKFTIFNLITTIKVNISFIISYFIKTDKNSKL